MTVMKGIDANDEQAGERSIVLVLVFWGGLGWIG